MLFKGLKMFVHVNCTAETVKDVFINMSVRAMIPSSVPTCASTSIWFADILLPLPLLLLLIPKVMVYSELEGQGKNKV
nr:unnamed protein product [Callosobruchus chinensis]